MFKRVLWQDFLIVLFLIAVLMAFAVQIDERYFRYLLYGIFIGWSITSRYKGKG